MKYLGIDYGTKRIGLAMSDELGMLATPHKTIDTKDAVVYIVSLCELNHVDAIIIGKSLDSSGLQNEVQFSINDFASKIKDNIKIPVYFQDESFSSHVAHGTQGKEVFNSTKKKINKTDNLDARAAAVILQRYLDKIKNK